METWLPRQMFPSLAAHEMCCENKFCCSEIVFAFPETNFAFKTYVFLFSHHENNVDCSLKEFPSNGESAKMAEVKEEDPLEGCRKGRGKRKRLFVGCS